MSHTLPSEVTERIASLKGQITCAVSASSTQGLAVWEQREYLAAKAMAEKELANLRASHASIGIFWA
jgi:hypothetical protein